MALESILSQEIMQRLGWTLLHFIWQATAAALLLAITLAALRRSTASLRYGIACLALGLMVLLPVVTMLLVPASTTPQPIVRIEPPPAPVIVPIQPTAEKTPVARAAEYKEPTESESTNMAGRIPWKQRAAAILEPALPYLVMGWLIGVFGLSLWHLGGWAQLQRLRRKLIKPVNASLRATLKQLADKLGVDRAVELLESAWVQVPMVVGWLRPVILLPAVALTGLSAEQLEALLAHELAHVRRHDYLLNILQTVVETLGFYHPAVWWVSHRICIERENCCDDLAVSLCGDRVRYAGALTSMEEIRAGCSEFAVAASGGSLVARVTRLLGRPVADDRRFAWLAGLITLLLVAGFAIPGTFHLVALGESMDVGRRGDASGLYPLWAKLDAVEAEKRQLARQRWDVLPVVEQAELVRRGWTQAQQWAPRNRPGDQLPQMNEGEARKFLADAKRQSGEHWEAHLAGATLDLLTQDERDRFEGRRKALVAQIAALGEPMVEPLIAEILGEKSHQMDAIRALKQMGRPVVPALLDATASAKDRPLRVLLDILGETQDPRARETLHRLLDDDDPHARLAALEALESLGPVPQRIYLRFLEDEYDWLRRAAVAGLAEAGDEHVIAALLEVAHHDLMRDKAGEFFLREEAFRAIRRICDRTGKAVELPPEETWRQGRPVSFESLVEAVGCDNAGIRTDAIAALGRDYHQKRTLELLMSVLVEDPSPHIRVAAVSAIRDLFADMGESARPLELSPTEREPVFNAILDMILDEQLAISQRAAALGNVPAVGGPHLPDYARFSELFSSVLYAIASEEREFQLAGLHVLSRLGYEHPETLEQHLTAERRQRLRSHLVAGMENTEVGYRIRFIEALGYLRERSVVPRLIELLGHDDPTVRSFATHALGRIGDRRALPALGEVAEHDSATDPGGDFYLRRYARKAIEQILTASQVISSSSQAVQIHPAGKLVLKLVDPNSQPVVGAWVGTFVDWSDVAESPPVWFLNDGGSYKASKIDSAAKVISNEEGKITLTEEELFKPQWPPERTVPLTAIDEGHYLAGLRELSREDLGTEVTLSLQPGCRVYGRVSDAAARKRKWSTKTLTVYVDWRDHRLCQYTSKQARFEFILPPGKYEVEVYADDPDKAVILPILIKPGQRNLDLTNYLDGTSSLPDVETENLLESDEGRIEGKIIDINTGKGISGVQLAAVLRSSPESNERFVCTSENNGTFAIGNLRSGEYRLQGDFPSVDVDVTSGQCTRDVLIGVDRRDALQAPKETTAEQQTDVKIMIDLRVIEMPAHAMKEAFESDESLSSELLVRNSYEIADRLLTLTEERKDAKLIVNPQLLMRNNGYATVSSSEHMRYISGYESAEREPSKLTPQHKVLDAGFRYTIHAGILESGNKIHFELATWQQRLDFETRQYRPGYDVQIPSPPEIFVTEISAKNGEPVVIGRLRRGETAFCLIATPSVIVPQPQPDSLLGKELPELNGIQNIDGLKQVKGRPILICFWDMNQRPSRNMVTELAKRDRELQAKEIVTVLVHTSGVEAAKLEEWLADHKIPSTCGSIQTDANAVLFRWGVRAQPWLILTDHEGIVRAEGFSLDQLDEKLRD